MKQRPFNLNPTGHTVYKVTHPAVEAARPRFILEPMRFVPHKGVARATFVPNIVPAEHVNNGAYDGR